MTRTAVGAGVLAVAVRIAFVVLVDPDVPPLGDARNFHLLGAALADGHGYVRAFELAFRDVALPTAEFPPLFPAFLAGLTELGADGETAQRVATSLLGGVTAGLAVVLGRRIHGTAAGAVAGAVVALHPLLFGLDTTPLSEALFVPLVLGALVTVERQPAVGGLLVGLAALTRSEALLLLPLLVFPIAWRRRSWRFAAVATAVVALVLAPWAVRNSRAFDEFVPTSHNLATAVAGANCDATYGGDDLGSWVFGCLERRRVGALGDEVAQSRNYREKGVDYATSHAGEWPKVGAARVLRTWGLWPDLDNQLEDAEDEGRVRGWERAATWLDRLLLPLAVAGAVLLVRERDGRLLPIVAAVPAMVTIATLVTYGNQRFRAVAVPVVAVLAAVAVVRPANRRSVGSLP